MDVVGADGVGEGGGLDDAGLGGRLAVPLPGTADEQAVSTASSASAPVLIRPLSQSRSRAAPRHDLDVKVQGSPRHPGLPGRARSVTVTFTPA